MRLDGAPSAAEISALLDGKSTSALMRAAADIRDQGHGRLQTWSPKVFIPLTRLCRNYCHYCTFTKPPVRGQNCYLTIGEVLAIAEAGARAGCSEALFTLGDKPELRFRAAREELERLGHLTTISYLAEMCAAVRDETGMLPHVNAGVTTAKELSVLRKCSASQGLMLESISNRLMQRGGAHHKSPDKLPPARLETLSEAGKLAIPFTTGILVGIGETRAERVEALAAIRDLNSRHGHIQEVIIQNFRAKAGTAMAFAAEPSLDEMLWSIAVARLILGPEMNIQAPPNLSPSALGKLIEAGINDFGGVSPVTPDHVNPEAPWPEVARLQQVTEQAGRLLTARLPIYPDYIHHLDRWTDPPMRGPILAACDLAGLARRDSWSPGLPIVVKARKAHLAEVDPQIASIVSKPFRNEEIDEAEIVTLTSARGPDLEHVCERADMLRKAVNGDVVTYVVNRNINYTNICAYKCGFCAFSKGSTDETLRGRPYDLDHQEVIRRTREAWQRGATEVCLQGGIHPHYTGRTYLELLRAVRHAVPEMHIHAFSPLEVFHGARTLGVTVESFLTELKANGLNTLPGTAAEILDDEVRAVICPDKLTSGEWLDVVETAHRVGLKTTSTVMFGHVEKPYHWARHLIRIRDLQQRTGGITEFVPLPFVHMEAPIALRGAARLGPTFKEVRLMHAIARLSLHPHVTSIQTSWVKLGAEGVKACLSAGANDLGGTLMNESISRAAGTQHGQEMPPETMESVIGSMGRIPRQRSTEYGEVSEAIRIRGRNAAPLTPMIQTRPVKRHQVTLQKGSVDARLS